MCFMRNVPASQAPSSSPGEKYFADISQNVGASAQTYKCVVTRLTTVFPGLKGAAGVVPRPDIFWEL